MIDENKKIKIKWNSRNKQHFVDKGYIYTKQGDELEVQIKDLPNNSSYELDTTCDYCGKPMKIRYYDYRRKIDNFGCNYCKSCMWNYSLSERQEKYYNKCLQICEQEGYTLLTKRDEMPGYHEYLEYECPYHGVQKIRLGNFFSGKRCPECNLDRKSELYRLPVDEVIKRIEECGGHCHNPEDYINNSERNLIIDCPRCGQPFTTSLVLFTQWHGQLCPDCRRKESVGENKIRNYLERHGIEYKQEYWFKDCRDVKPLPFDFYLPQQNTIIEFDGTQHYRDSHYFNDFHFGKLKAHDQIKNEYCENNNIKLIRIPYWKIDKIDEILDESL